MERRLQRPPSRSSREPSEVLPARTTEPPALSAQEAAAEYPILCRDRFERLRKASKREDLRRMVQSPQSEDWVTWNLFQLLLTQHPDAWWKWMEEAARTRNPEALLPDFGDTLPEVELWSAVAAPAAYESASRERMRRSGDPAWVSRSLVSRAVEGPSEIDIVLRHERALVYIEAKLHSDISVRTTYDPTRNQIARNIDCLLEAAVGRVPIFWMLARDEEAGLAYSQLMQQYRTHPETLAEALPHRDPASIGIVAGNLAILLWRDFSPALAVLPTDSEDIAGVKRELLRRIA